MYYKRLSKQELREACKSKNIIINDETSREEMISLLEEHDRKSAEENIIDVDIVKDNSQAQSNENKKSDQYFTTVKIFKTGICKLPWNKTMEVKMGEILKVDNITLFYLKKQGFTG